jgi:hypothetical protein
MEVLRGEEESLTEGRCGSSGRGSVGGQSMIERYAVGPHTVLPVPQAGGLLPRQNELVPHGRGFECRYVECGHVFHEVTTVGGESSLPKEELTWPR